MTAPKRKSGASSSSSKKTTIPRGAAARAAEKKRKKDSESLKDSEVAADAAGEAAGDDDASALPDNEEPDEQAVDVNGDTAVATITLTPLTINAPSSAPSATTSATHTPKGSDKGDNGKVRKDPDVHPYARGAILSVLYLADNTARLCDVIERSELSSSTASKPLFKYYVHYHDFNRRMDEWVSPGPRIISLPSAAGAQFKALGAAKKKKEAEEKKIKEREELERMDREIKEEQEGGGSRKTRLRKTESSSPRPDGESSNEINVVAVAEIDEHEGMDEASLREHEEVTKVKNISTIEMSRFVMDTWYFSPYPKSVVGEHVDILYLCEFTFKFYLSKSAMLRDQSRPGLMRHPPGNEIYRKGKVSMFEVDGMAQREYSQNLCYLAKLFLDHKTLYYDVDPFLFYVLCESDEFGYHPVGYYSKEKYSDVGYNLACILTFPCHQRKGYGRFLIDFSYALSKREEKVGSPEKPMSDLGQQAYKPYWTSTIVDYLDRNRGESHKSIMQMSKETSIMCEDIVFTLNQMGLLRHANGEYFLAAEDEIVDHLLQKHPVKQPVVDDACLHWTPFLISDVPKRDKFSIHNKRAGAQTEENLMVVTGEFGGGRGDGSGALGR